MQGAPGGPPAGVERGALLNLLGLAARARALVHGTDAARNAARDGKLAGAVVAADASPTQARKLVPLLEARGIPFAVCLTRDDLGGAIGKGAVSAVGIVDRNFAGRLMELAAALPQSQDRAGGEQA
ncbi:MAG TPA: ribosomal L7Ae/L30e/S12e/Gadd45 family protein [Longimicrobium sp.]|nr:ribosomal L7Ae/L30e/S12e/Gadd45 family protein [Longimicrobium sp.]